MKVLFFLPSILVWVWMLYQVTQVWRERHHGYRKARRDRHHPDLGPEYLAARLAILAERARAAGAATSAIASSIGAVGAAARTFPADPRVKETTADVPILAFKKATLTWGEDGFYLKTLKDTIVLPEEFAVCRLQDGFRGLVTALPQDLHNFRHHPSPWVGCLCGFHAVRSMDDISRAVGDTLMEVELSGRVLVAEYGYRAQHQRVLRIHPPECLLCKKPSTHLWLSEDAQSYFLAEGWSEAKGKFYGDTGGGIPKCDGCASTGFKAATIPIEVALAQTGLPFVKAGG